MLCNPDNVAISDSETLDGTLFIKIRLDVYMSKVQAFSNTDPGIGYTNCNIIVKISYPKDKVLFVGSQVNWNDSFPRASELALFYRDSTMTCSSATIISFDAIETINTYVGAAE